jgi:hypothetical protein
VRLGLDDCVLLDRGSIVAWQHSNTSAAAPHSLALLLLVISDDGCFFLSFLFFYFVRCLASGSLYAAKVNVPVNL